MPISNSKKNKSVIPRDIEDIILASVLNVSKEFLLTHPNIPLSSKQSLRFKTAKRKLLHGQPLGYALGFTWFYGHKFSVSKKVLIPRPETEQLVDLAIEYTKKYNPQTIYDIGTGSGAIIISLAKALETGLDHSKLIAIDISNTALDVAKSNARTLHSPKINFIKG